MPEVTDSILTAAEATTPVAAELHTLCRQDEAPMTATERATFTIGRPAHMQGLAPRERAVLPGYDSAVVCLVLGLFIFVSVNFKHYSTFLKTFSAELLSVRRRPNVFDDHTVSESRILISLIMVVCFSEASLLFSLIYTTGIVRAVFPLLITLLGVTIGYYVIQLCAYSVVGHVFTDRQNAQQWLKGFNASQSILGIALVIPALVTLFYPGTSMAMFSIGAALYVAARLIFICKGFKIFYHNLFSLLYFILYLCALEIAPLLMVYRGRELISLL